jgi:hypothetical protein
VWDLFCTPTEEWTAIFCVGLALLQPLQQQLLSLNVDGVSKLMFARSLSAGEAAHGKKSLSFWQESLEQPGAIEQLQHLAMSYRFGADGSDGGGGAAVLQRRRSGTANPTCHLPVSMGLLRKLETDYEQEQERRQQASCNRGTAEGDSCAGPGQQAPHEVTQQQRQQSRGQQLQISGSPPTLKVLLSPPACLCICSLTLP